GFDWWFRNKVATGLRSGERKIFFETRECRVAGIAIAKREMQERKLCTLYVLPEFRNTGVASELAAEAFEWLGTEKPLFSVPEERIYEFRTLIRMWDFHQTNRILGAYREGKVEYVFNGHLRPLC
ncbi:MAG: GNAT family N-acetyltransferase, partial [Methylocystis silviterrae]